MGHFRGKVLRVNSIVSLCPKREFRLSDDLTLLHPAILSDQVHRETLGDTVASLLAFSRAVAILALCSSPAGMPVPLLVPLYRGHDLRLAVYCFALR